jgi:outer membrane receptor protein involved in Fe transport
MSFVMCKNGDSKRNLVMRKRKAELFFVNLAISIPFGLAFAQDDVGLWIDQSTAQSPSSLFQSSPLFNIERRVSEHSLEGDLVNKALNFNLGMRLEPVEGLSLIADAWQMQLSTPPSVEPDTKTNLYADESSLRDFDLENPIIGDDLKSSGFDVGASYGWSTDRFGEFTLSSTTTYVDQFKNSSFLLDLGKEEFGAPEERMLSPELQTSLMLAWKFGNHTASAITNYFDSYKDINDLDMDEVNTLVKNLTTLDLSYDYNVKSGAQDRAVISFGIRNIFNEKGTQILNAATRILDQNGRVAYGSIKYKF